MIKKLSIILFISLLAPKLLFAKSKYFQEGIDLFDQKKFEDAKFKFEQDLVFNPKSELAIYNLAKLKLSNSDFEKSIELNKKLKLICNNFCRESDRLKTEIENLSKK